MDIDLTPAGIEGWLREENPEKLAMLYAAADAVRRENVGDAVHLRGLVEFSNICRRQCGYCGIRAGNAAARRYRLERTEVLECALLAEKLGYGTVVLQGGEDFSVTAEWWGGVIREIKEKTALAVTLSLGERHPDELARWKEAGADRYLLRFETGNPRLYRRIHPDAGGEVSDRLALLRTLRALGYETGSGVMVGVPGQTFADAVRDALLFRSLDLDMIGIGPYLPHPQTPLYAEAREVAARAAAGAAGEQILPTAENACKMVALARLLCPRSNIPSTTALAAARGGGHELGLRRGANVIMPNVTPAKYRALYAIYPEKEKIDAPQSAEDLGVWLASFGRVPGRGRGDSARAAVRADSR